MNEHSRPTCEELSTELKNFQQRFQLLEKNNHDAPDLSLADNISIHQNLLDESQKLVEEVQNLNEKFVPIEVIHLLHTLGQQYENAKVLALEFHELPKKIPSKEVILKKMFALGVEKLRKIANFAQPTLLITPASGMRDKQLVLNQNLNYPGQLKSDWDPSEDDEELWDNPFETSMVSIVEGLPTLPQLPDRILKDEDGELTEFSVRYAKSYRELEDQGLRMITSHEYALLMRQSMKNYQNAARDPSCQNPHKEIVDFYVRKDQLIGSYLQKKSVIYTVFHQPEFMLDELERIPAGGYFFWLNKIHFTYYESEENSEAFRVRPAIDVFSF